MNKNPLQSTRVLDLTDEKGFLCGKILADLGAQVIKVERPGGDRSRNIPPFYHNECDPEKSLYWFAYNRNKKGITLDIQTSGGQDIFKRLVKTADIILESFPVGYLDKLGLGYAALTGIQPKLIFTSITPFGQVGPYKNYKADDLTLLAMGGLLYITGYPDRPPVRISFPQSWLLAGSNAAASTMVAYYHRQVNGEGQHVDVSVQASIAWVITNTIPLWELGKTNLIREGSVLSGRYGKINQRILWRCLDGFVAYLIFGGTLGVRMGNCKLAEWIEEEGLSDDYLRNFKWENYDLAVETQETQDKLESYLERLFLKYSKLELYNQGLKRNIRVFPVYSPGDMLKDPQLKSRDFWTQVEHPELKQTLDYPGLYFKSSDYPTSAMSKAPLIGEHNEEIYKELGIVGRELSQLKQNRII